MRNKRKKIINPFKASVTHNIKFKFHNKYALRLPRQGQSIHSIRLPFRRRPTISFMQTKEIQRRPIK